MSCASWLLLATGVEEGGKGEEEEDFEDPAERRRRRAMEQLQQELMPWGWDDLKEINPGALPPLLGRGPGPATA